mmetsp:Transcript_36696/g.96453  ORF Transcript_36696/g.96453 Transcript_36696/m.96453 type:complete len:322 (+) Transcript_36696:479-1444(+)
MGTAPASTTAVRPRTLEAAIQCSAPHAASHTPACERSALTAVRAPSTSAIASLPSTPMMVRAVQPCSCTCSLSACASMALTTAAAISSSCARRPAARGCLAPAPCSDLAPRRVATLASVATRLGAKSEQGAGARQPRAAGRRAQLELMAAAVVSAMDAHAESEQVQLHGCTALTIIGVEGSDAIAEVDGARTAVKALRSHAGVWEAACGALHCIAASSVRGRTAVVEAGAVPIVREVMATDRLDSRGTATGWGRGDVATHPENQEWPFAAFSFVHVRHVHVLCHSLYLWLQTIVPAWAQPPPMPSPAQPAPVPVAPGLAAM